VENLALKRVQNLRRAHENGVQIAEFASYARRILIFWHRILTTLTILKQDATTDNLLTNATSSLVMILSYVCCIQTAIDVWYTLCSDNF